MYQASLRAENTLVTILWFLQFEKTEKLFIYINKNTEILTCH